MNALLTTQDKSFSVNELTKITVLVIVAILFLGSHAFAQRNSHNPTLLKLNISPMFNGEYGIGVEHKLSKRTSIYGDVSFLNKDESEISGVGFGTKVGLRHYISIKRSYKQGTHKNKLKAFSGNYISIEGRRGSLSPQAELSISDDVQRFSKLAMHIGTQRSWKHFFLNAEVGPSFGNSDFAAINDNGYYTDGVNLDGRLSIGLAF